MTQQASNCDPALKEALKRQKFADGGEVDDNAGDPISTKASVSADSVQPLGQSVALPSASGSTGSSPANIGGGGQQMPGQSQFGKLPDANPPNFPKINVISNAYSPNLRPLPTPQSRQQQAQAALAPFIQALAQLKARQ